MRYALVGGKRHAAERGLAGQCPACGAAMIPKCGERRVWHWAHRGERHCDHWWEPETEWHVAWKNRFPAEWQEISCPAENGEKHIADVKTPHGWVVEFQHSPPRCGGAQRARSLLQKDGLGDRRARAQAGFPDLLWYASRSLLKTTRLSCRREPMRAAARLERPSRRRVFRPRCARHTPDRRAGLVACPSERGRTSKPRPNPALDIHQEAA